MKPYSILNKIITSFLLLILGVSGIKVADLIYSHYPQIARGVLGALIVYLIYRNVLMPIANEPISALFEFPGNIKYFLYSFFGAILIYWGLQQIALMILMRN